MSRCPSNEDMQDPYDDRSVFELTSRFDDGVEPSEVTVSPADADNPTTQWLTIDAEHAIPSNETL